MEDRNRKISDIDRLRISVFSDDSEKGRFNNTRQNSLVNPKNAIICSFPISILPKNGLSVYSDTEHRGILRNVISISAAFTLLFTAYQSMANLQSSLNHEKSGPVDKNVDGEINLTYLTTIVLDDEFAARKLDQPPKNASAENGSTTRNYNKGENWRMLKNVIVISLCFTLLFTAFNSMSNLQSSLNSEDGLGPYSLATLYAALVLSSMFLPTFLIQKFTAKWTLVFSMLGYILYIAAQFYPTFATLIPAAIILGFCAAPLWSAKCTYLTHVGHQYAGMVSDTAEVVIVRFFGIFFFAFQSSQIWGNLISSSVLSSGSNSTTIGKDISFCGVNFCPSDVNGGGDEIIGKPDKKSIYTLAGIYLGCAVLAAILVAIFVDPLTRYGERDRDGGNKLSGQKLLSATFRQMVKPIQILIIPLTIWSGMEQGFFSSDFTQAYITCSWGVENVGYVMICYGVCDAIASISFGQVIRHLGRIPVFIFGAILNISMILTMIFWKPDPNAPILFFVIAGIWGIGDAIWQTQINALYGVLFEKNEEAAFSNYRLWESIGFIIAYVNTNNICVNAKLYSLLGIISLGMLGYFITEIISTANRRKNTVVT